MKKNNGSSERLDSEKNPLLLDVKEWWGAYGNKKAIAGACHLTEDDWQADFEADLALSKTSTGFFVSGEVKGKAQVCCDKCLDDFLMPVTFFLHERYVLSAFTQPESRGKEQELHEEDFYEVIDGNGVLDLSDVFRQFFLLEYVPPFFCNDCSYGKAV